jgi:elongation factor P--beta-lysine ligase
VLLSLRLIDLIVQPGCAERFELLIGGQEFCNAYNGMFRGFCFLLPIASELNDPTEQRNRMQLQAKVWRGCVLIVQSNMRMVSAACCR